MSEYLNQLGNIKVPSKQGTTLKGLNIDAYLPLQYVMGLDSLPVGSPLLLVGNPFSDTQQVAMELMRLFISRGFRGRVVNTENSYNYGESRGLLGSGVDSMPIFNLPDQSSAFEVLSESVPGLISLLDSISSASTPEDDHHRQGRKATTPVPRPPAKADGSPDLQAVAQTLKASFTEEAMADAKKKIEEELKAREDFAKVIASTTSDRTARHLSRVMDKMAGCGLIMTAHQKVGKNGHKSTGPRGRYKDYVAGVTLEVTRNRVDENVDRVRIQCVTSKLSTAARRWIDVDVTRTDASKPDSLRGYYHDYTFDWVGASGRLLKRLMKRDHTIRQLISSTTAEHIEADGPTAKSLRAVWGIVQVPQVSSL